MKNSTQLFSRTFAKGFTLVELLVTIIIGAFITLAAVTFMHNTAMSYHTTDMTARLQENARFAIQMLSYDIRQAGYYGCSGERPDTIANNIDGVDGAGAASDELVIRFSNATGGAVDILNPPERGDSELEIVLAGSATSVTASDYFQDGQQIVISDCMKSEVVTIDTVGTGNNKIFLDGGVEEDYNTTTTVRSFSDTSYIVKARDDDSVPALYRIRDGVEEPLVDGVEYLRVLYGVDTDSDSIPDVYRPIGPIADTETLVSLKLGMLARSISNKTRGEDNPGEYGLESNKAAGSLKPYRVLDQASDVDLFVKPEDGHGRVTRRSFTTTLFLRNKT